ncbi:hypothetical protein RIVM261_062560 [Rivularia sp. IAM M-261]|nr:hypothetical protein CAL7716_048740 [Calothrix sp. PCC 7716]GJD21300.1 hypothetical protein RIVM261_062560 [Rivularia sp. IAM M-261]
MKGIEALQSVQFVTVKGKRLAVVDADSWEALIEWLETLEDMQIARKELVKLKNVGNNPEQAGYLKWDDVEHELE